MRVWSICISPENLSIAVCATDNDTSLLFPRFVCVSNQLDRLNKFRVQLQPCCLLYVVVVLHALALETTPEGRLRDDEDAPGETQDRRPLPVFRFAQVAGHDSSHWKQDGLQYHQILSDELTIKFTVIILLVPHILIVSQPQLRDEYAVFIQSVIAQHSSDFHLMSYIICKSRHAIHHTYWCNLHMRPLV